MENYKKPKYSVKDVANYFLAYGNEVGELITNLKLQKLVFYAQAWHLANFGEPLFEEEFQAWVHGPVVPELYRTYKEQGSMPIVTDLKKEEVERVFSSESRSLLEEVVEAYMTESAYALELMTHREDPWIKARGESQPDDRCENIISKGSMMEFYGERISQKNSASI